MIPPRSVKSVVTTLFARPALLADFQNALTAAAEAEGVVEEEFDATGETQICPSRLHADFVRLMRGQSPAFPENVPALDEIRAELDVLGFSTSRRDRFRRSARVGLVGEVDAMGEIEGMPAIVELKVVSKIPSIPRAQDVAQLLLYDLLHHGGIGGTVLIVLYVQNHGEFRADSRIVVDPTALTPLVRQLLA